MGGNRKEEEKVRGKGDLWEFKRGEKVKKEGRLEGILRKRKEMREKYSGEMGRGERVTERGGGGMGSNGWWEGGGGGGNF